MQVACLPSANRRSCARAMAPRILKIAFVAYLQEAETQNASHTTREKFSDRDDAQRSSAAIKRSQSGESLLVYGSALALLRRTWTFARREALELLRDPVRLAFALLGPLICWLHLVTAFPLTSKTFAMRCSI